MLNYVWLGMIVLGVVLGALTGRSQEVSDAFLSWSERAVMGVALPLAGMFTLMLGVMRLVEKSGFIALLARWFRPVLRRLFPEVPPDHPAMGAMMMNLAANFLGAGNASTPFGLRAMAQLEKLNPQPGTATNAMCTFLVLNTSALTLISTTGLALLKKGGAANPTAVIGPSILATLGGLLVGLFVLRLCRNLPIFAVRPLPTDATATATADAKTTEAATVGDENKAVEPPRLVAWKRGVLALFFGVLGFGFLDSLSHGAMSAALREFRLAEVFTAMGEIFPRVSAELSDGSAAKVFAEIMLAVSGLVLPAFLTFFILYAALAGLKVFEDFIEGAKEGIQTVLRIIPYLVGMIVGVGVLRASGAIDGLAWLLREKLKIAGAFPDLLPMVLMRPLSGSGSQAVLANVIDRFGANSYEALTATTMYGSTETTFYVLAVYFGSIGIKRIRHALVAGLVADAVSMVTAMFLCQFLVR